MARSSQGNDLRRRHHLWSTRGLIWFLNLLATKLPVAMSPLSFLFLGSELYGSYGYGLVLVGLYALAEAIAAPCLGFRLNRSYFIREVSRGLLVTAAAMTGIALLQEHGEPIAWVLATLAGASSAAVPGALRVAVTNIVPAPGVRPAYSLETAITMVCWAAAPALVALLSFGVSPLTPFLVSGILMGLGAGLSRLLSEHAAHPDSPDTTRRRTPRQDWRTLRSAWPVLLIAALAMSVVSLIELLLPARLEELDLPQSWAGPLLSALAIASIIGAVGYAGIRASGSFTGQTWAAIGVMLAAGVGLAVAPAVPAIVAALSTLGVAQAVCVIARNMSLREHLPEDLHVPGFALLYSLSGIGYGISAGFSALLLPHLSAQGTLLIGFALITVISIAVWAQQRRASR